MADMMDSIYVQEFIAIEQNATKRCQASLLGEAATCLQFVFRRWSG